MKSGEREEDSRIVNILMFDKKATRKEHSEYQPRWKTPEEDEWVQGYHVQKFLQSLEEKASDRRGDWRNLRKESLPASRSREKGRVGAAYGRDDISKCVRVDCP